MYTLCLQAWAGTLELEGETVAVEYDGTSVTSPGSETWWGRLFPLDLIEQVCTFFVPGNTCTWFYLECACMVVTTVGMAIVVISIVISSDFHGMLSIRVR